MYCGALPIRRIASPGDFERRVATTFIMWGCESVLRDLWVQFSLITAGFPTLFAFLTQALPWTSRTKRIMVVL